MGLGLDLSASYAKLARARSHLDALEREITTVLDKRKPYTITSEVDQVNGWCSIFVVSPYQVPEQGLGVIVGDVIHNLRCALDYIVTALVQASSASLTRSHQFPIFDDAEAYLSKVGDDRSAKESGPLRHIKFGLREIWELQPFHKKPEPTDDPLFLVNRFSNTDKHRMIMEYWTALGTMSFNLQGIGVIVEDHPMPSEIDWEPNRKYEVARMRFAAPYPRDVLVEVTAPVKVHFGSPRFGKYMGSMIPTHVLTSLYDHVVTVTDLFKAL